MSKSATREAREEDLIDILADVRDGDLNEGLAWSVLPFAQQLCISLDASTHAWVGTWKGVPACVMGVSPRSILNGIGCPWMIGTNELDRHAKELLQLSPGILEKMLSVYPTLINHVDVRNRRNVRWLKWLGFEFFEPEPFGHLQLPFYRFEMRR